MIVVADTTPLNYLIQLDCTSVLPILYQRVLIPSAVQQELLHPRAPQQVRDWIASPPAWLEVTLNSEWIDPSLSNLDEGEAEAIQLAEQVRADRVAIDEALGRDIATTRGLQVIGTLGILREASQRGMIDLRAKIPRLQALGFRVAQHIITAVLDS